MTKVKSILVFSIIFFFTLFVILGNSFEPTVTTVLMLIALSAVISIVIGSVFLFIISFIHKNTEGKHTEK